MLLTFGWEKGAPWHDKRVRQALSMMMDRETYSDVIFSRKEFAADGLDVPIRYNSIVPGGWTRPTKRSSGRRQSTSS